MWFIKKKIEKIKLYSTSIFNLINNGVYHVILENNLPVMTKELFSITFKQW